MKKRIVSALALCIALVVSLLAGCAGAGQQSNTEYSVSFSYNYFTFDEVPDRQTI